MIGKFDETFYKNKRSALGSSFVLLMACAVPISLSKNTPFFQVVQFVENVPSSWILWTLLIIAFYFNLSFLLHYATEIPRWLKEPSGELQQIQALQTLLVELKISSGKQISLFSENAKSREQIISSLRTQLELPSPEEFGAAVEHAVLRKIEAHRSEVWGATLNAISGALRTEKSVHGNLHQSINLENLSREVVKNAAEGLKSIVQATMLDIPNRQDARVQVLIKGTKASMAALDEKETEAIRDATVVQSRLESLTRGLKRWSTLFSFRTTVWYLYLPVALFLSAVGCAALVLSTGASTIKLVARALA